MVLVEALRYCTKQHSNKKGRQHVYDQTTTDKGNQNSPSNGPRKHLLDKENNQAKQKGVRP